MKLKKKEEYFKPEIKVFRVYMNQSLLTMSGPDVSLEGAGVDESEAEENGDIWNN